MRHSHPIAEIARSAGHFDLFDFDGSYQGSLSAAAESAMVGRTHYFDADTRRFHGSRVVHMQTLCSGLVLGAIERTALNFERSAFGFRPVFIAADGYVLDRPSIDECKKTKAAALKEYKALAAKLTEREVFDALLARKESSANRKLRQVADARAALEVLK